MLADETRKRQNLLIEKLIELSKTLLDEMGIRKIALELNEIYTSEFRHSYSDFFPIILKIIDGSGCSIDYLSNNLEALREYVENDFITGENEFKEMHKSFDKLCDHLNLEIGRVIYYSQNESKTDDLSRRMETINESMKASAKALESASKRAETMQTELISVLSIFAAIVIAFSGGLSFMGSAISGAQNTYVCKLILILLICGFVLFNTIFLLMYLVGKIIGRNIYAICITENCTCGDGHEPKCRNIIRVKKRLPYVFYFNVAVIFFITLDIIVWCLDKWVI